MSKSEDENKDVPSTSGDDGMEAPGQNNAPRHVPSTSKDSPIIARRKITRPPRLESVSESEISSNVDSPSSTSEFGVRSYLHNFYEPGDGVTKNNDEYYPGDERRSSKTGGRICSDTWWRRRCSCAALWWKAGVFVGANILILAVLALLIGYLVKPREEVMDYRADVAVVNQDNAAFNRKLDAAKLAGLIMLCAGGFIVAISLLVPSVVNSNSWDHGNPDEIHIDPDENFPPYMPLKNADEEMMEDGIPYTSELTNVQPERSGGESVVAGKGMVNVQSSWVSALIYIFHLDLRQLHTATLSQIGDLAWRPDPMFPSELRKGDAKVATSEWWQWNNDRSFSWRFRDGCFLNPNHCEISWHNWKDLAYVWSLPFLITLIVVGSHCKQQ